MRDLSTVTAERDCGQTGNNVYRTAEGHGFEFEDGWSSVNLRPYYVENLDNKLAKLDEPSDFIISDVEQMPVRFTNTVVGFEELLTGETDIFFCSKPSEAQYRTAEEKGAELVLTPIGSDAFVFFVNIENPVDGLTSDQIRKTYSGEYTRWKQAGGSNIPILAFQRPEGSGSQTGTEYFMGDVPLKEPLEVEYKLSMAGVIKEVASYENKESAIWYSFRYYVSKMFHDDNIKFLSVDGVHPDAEAIRGGSYPLAGNLYAITLKGNENPAVEPFWEWMTDDQGKQILNRTGYIA